jgi:hypothetical protein
MGIEPTTFRLVAQWPQAYREHFITKKLHNNLTYSRSQNYTPTRFDYFYSHLQEAWIYKRRSSNLNGKMCRKYIIAVPTCSGENTERFE